MSSFVLFTSMLRVIEHENVMIQNVIEHKNALFVHWISWRYKFFGLMVRHLSTCFLIALSMQYSNNILLYCMCNICLYNVPCVQCVRVRMQIRRGSTGVSWRGWYSSCCSAWSRWLSRRHSWPWSSPPAGPTRTRLAHPERRTTPGSC